MNYIKTFLIRIFATLFSMLSSLGVAKIADPNVAGDYFFLLSVATFLGVFLSFGLGQLFTRKFSDAEELEIKSSYIFSVTIFILVITLIFWVLGKPLYMKFISDEYGKLVLKYEVEMILISSTWGLLIVYCGAILGCNKVNLSTSLLNLAPYVPLSFTCAYFYFLKSEMELDYIIYSFMIGIVFAAILSFYNVFFPVRNLKRGLVRLKFDGAISFWIITLSQAFLFSGVVIFAGQNLESSDLAGFYTAHRICAVIIFPMVVVNLIVMPKFSKAKFNNDLRALIEIANKYTLLPILLSLPIFLIFSVCSEYVLGFIGSEYLQYSNVFLVLLFGNIFALVCGPVVPLLSMAGEEMLVANINVFLVLPILFLSVFLTDRMGVEGLAIAVSALLIIQNSLYVFFVKRRFGFIPILGR